MWREPWYLLPCEAMVRYSNPVVVNVEDADQQGLRQAMLFGRVRIATQTQYCNTHALAVAENVPVRRVRMTMTATITEATTPRT